MTEIKLYDVLIIGAGPAGTTTAMAMRDMGYKVGVIDKSVFPRDKVCGDALGGKVDQVLKKLSPEIQQKFRSFPSMVSVTGCRLFSPNSNFVDVVFKNQGHFSRRMDFDNHLLELAKEFTDAEFIEGFEAKDVTINDDYAEISRVGNGQILRSKILIGCDGAHSVLAKKLANFTVEKDHYCGAVRAYYKNVKLPMENLTTSELNPVKSEFVPH
ncbi:MAG: FAD-dependent monooxygenase [Bacteroidetes bacterium]|nr:FAD-dependent monooxygenase [Bacteroidota bacterium]